MASTPNVGLPLNDNWTDSTVKDWAQGINDANNPNSAFAILDRFLSNLSTGLPTVSTADSGKILQVVDGKWAAASLVTYLGEHEVIN